MSVRNRYIALGLIVVAGGLYYKSQLREVPQNVIDAGYKHVSEAPVWARFLDGYQDEYANFRTKWREQPEITDLLKQSDQDLIAFLYAGKREGRSLVKRWSQRFDKYNLKLLWGMSSKEHREEYLGGDYFYVADKITGTRDGETLESHKYSKRVVIKDVLRVFNEKRITPACDVTWGFYQSHDKSERQEQFWYHSVSKRNNNDFISVIQVPLKPYSDKEVWDKRHVVYVVPLGDMMKKFGRSRLAKKLKVIFVEMEYHRVAKEWVLYKLNVEGSPRATRSVINDVCASTAEFNKGTHASLDTSGWSNLVGVRMRSASKRGYGQDYSMVKKLTGRDRSKGGLLMQVIGPWWGGGNGVSLNDKIDMIDWSQFDKFDTPVIRYRSDHGNLGMVRPEFYRPVYSYKEDRSRENYYAARNMFYSGTVSPEK